MQHVNKEYIGAFYRTTNGIFVIFLKEVELEDLYFLEIYSRGKVDDNTIFSESSHYLFVEEMNLEEISQMPFLWQCYYPQLFQTWLSKKLS